MLEKHSHCTSNSGYSRYVYYSTGPTTIRAKNTIMEYRTIDTYDRLRFNYYYRSVLASVLLEYKYKHLIVLLIQLYIQANVATCYSYCTCSTGDTPVLHIVWFLKARKNSLLRSNYFYTISLLAINNSQEETANSPRLNAIETIKM